LQALFREIIMALMKSLRLVALVIALLLGVTFPIATAAAAGIRSVTVALVVCSTSHGVEENPRNFPATQTVAIPAADQLQLSAYTDDQGELHLLAPRGWTCQASTGADGNDSNDAYPQGEIGSPARSWPKTAQAVTANLLPACVGCALSQACTYFPVAQQQLLKNYGPNSRCPKAPVGELTDRLSSTVVAYEDPSGVKGIEAPSGGNYAANGIVTYKPPTARYEYGSSLENCVLPPQVHALCTAALNNFVSQWDRTIAG
jgi:hypothetical protein